jgi:hypothetical protein
VVGTGQLSQTSNLKRLSPRSAVFPVHPVHGTEEARIVLLNAGTGGRTKFAQESVILFVRQFAASDDDIDSITPGITMLHMEHQVQLPVD